MAIHVLAVTAGRKLVKGTQTLHTGTARLGQAGSGFVTGVGAAAEPFAFFPPDGTPIASGESEPILLAEAWLMTATTPSSHGMDPMGIDTVTATYAPDPRGGDNRWLQISGTAFAYQPIQIGYRVIVEHTT